ncbi:MAG: hypothetical protein IJY22_08290 [Clostridia bacterium]|nr:hypothetical protein [Clostridia bacterium]
MEQNKKFEYTYSAPTEQERREIESIRRQYLDPMATAEGKLERLRRLDAYVANSATCWSLVVGVIGLLVFGLGMAMVLHWALYLWGILVAAVGVAPIACAYPLYRWMLRRNKAKYGEEILRLSEELLLQKDS